MKLFIPGGINPICTLEDAQLGTILGMNSEYVAIKTPGRSIYRDAARGTEYEPAKVQIFQIENKQVTTPMELDVDLVLEFNLRG
jgi:hypothetical protein